MRHPDDERRSAYANSYPPQQSVNAGEKIGQFADNAMAAGKKFASNANTFATQKLGFSLSDKKNIFMLIFITCMFVTLILMLFHPTKASYGGLFFGETVDSLVQSTYYSVSNGVGVFHWINIIFGFLPMLGATVVACIPLVTKNYKCGYLIFVRVMLIVDIVAVLLGWIIISSILSSESYGYVSASISGVGIFRWIFQIGSLVLTFLLRAEIIKSNPKPMYQNPAYAMPYGNQQNFQNPQGFQNPQNFQNPQGFQNPQNFQNPQGFQNQQNFQNPQDQQNYQNPQNPQNPQF